MDSSKNWPCTNIEYPSSSVAVLTNKWNLVFNRNIGKTDQITSNT